MEFTVKQGRFVQEYLIDGNATQAAIRAGYSEETAAMIGYENLRKPYILEAIKEAEKDRLARTLITQDWVLRMLQENAVQAKAASEIAAANGALKLIGEHLKMFTQKTESTVTTKRALSELTDAELREIAAGGSQDSVEAE